MMWIPPLVLIVIAFLRGLETKWLDKKKENGTVYAGWTLTVLNISFSIIVIGAVTEYLLTVRQLNVAATCAGIAIMLIRFGIKYWSHCTLGRYWSSSIEIRSQHSLIVEGPYRYVRHPVYFSGLLEILGIVLFLNAYWTLLWALPLRYFAFYLRIRLEEHALISYFGEQYSSYCMQTPALLPFIPLFLKKAV